MGFSKPSEFGGGAFFKPADHQNDVAILIEPKKVDKNVASEYKGQHRQRDEVTADLTIFGTSEALDKGEPNEISKEAKVVHGMLAGTLERIIGGAMVAVIRKTATRNGEGYVFRDVDAEVEAKVTSYYEAREKEREAAREDMPDFTSS